MNYDLLPRESDILGRRFWVKAFELLKKAGAARLETEGKNAGCWVMPLEGAPEFEGMEDADKILVRSNGTVTYTGKDVAYQLWKLGVLGIDFEYEEVPYRDVDGSPEFHASDGVSPLYRTRHDEEGADLSARGRFGHGTDVINVIDVRQSYPQKVVKRGGPARRLPRGRRPVRPLRVRDGRADAGFRGGARRRAHGRGSRASFRRDVGPPRARREGRRSPRPARREGEGPDPGSRERASRGRAGPRRSRSARCAST